MDWTIPMRANGRDYDIPRERVAEFKTDFPDAVEMRDYSGGGREYRIPLQSVEEFRQDFPDAKRLYGVTFANGTRRKFERGSRNDFFYSDEYLKGDAYKADRDLDASRAAAAKEAAVARQTEAHEADSAAIPADGDFSVLGDVAKSMFTAKGVRKAADQSWTAKPYAYAGDLVNSLIGGLVGGGLGVAKAVGNVASDRLRKAAERGEAAVAEALPTDLLDTSGGGLLNKVLETGKGVARVTGEFAPAAIPGVGGAYAGTLIGTGAVNRGADVYREAKANGLSEAEADVLAGAAGTVDALSNMLLMGKFKGVWKPALKPAATKASQGLVRRLLGETAKAAEVGGIMGVQGAANEALDEAARAENLNLAEIVNRGIDGFVEGGMFHLVNTGARKLQTKIWNDHVQGRAAKAREALETPEARAALYSNSPEAAAAIIKAREAGMDVTAEMLEKIGVPKQAVPTQDNCNAMADAMLNDFREWNSWVEDAYPKERRNPTANLEMLASETERARARAGDVRIALDEAGREIGDERIRREVKSERDETEYERARRRRIEADAEAEAFREWNDLFRQGKTDMTFEDYKTFRAEEQDAIRAKAEEQAAAEARAKVEAQQPVSTSEKISPTATEKPAETAEPVKEPPKTDASLTALAPTAPQPVEKATTSASTPPEVQSTLTTEKPVETPSRVNYATTTETTPPKGATVPAVEPPATTEKPVEPVEPATVEPPKAVNKPTPETHSLAFRNALKIAQELTTSARLPDGSWDVDALVRGLHRNKRPNLYNEDKEWHRYLEGLTDGEAAEFRAAMDKALARGAGAPNKKDSERVADAVEKLLAIPNDGNRSARAIMHGKSFNKKGLTYKELERLHNDETWHENLGLPEAEANALRAEVEHAYEASYFYQKHPGVFNAEYENMPPAKDRAEEIQRLAKSVDALAGAQEAAKKNGNDYFKEKIDTLLEERNKQVNALSAEDKAVFDAAAKKIGEASKKNVSGEEASFDVNKEASQNLTKEGGGTQNKSVRKGVSRNSGGAEGERVFTVESVDGDNVTVVQSNRDGDVVQTRTFSRQALEALAKVEPAWKGIADNPTPGQKIRRQIDDASPEARALRYATDADYADYLKRKGKVDSESMRDAYDRENATAAAQVAKNHVAGAKVKYENRDFDPNTDGGEGVRKSIVDDNGTIAQFDNPDGTITLYRAVKIDPDGAIRPPQSTQIKGPDGKYHDRPPEGYLQPDGRVTRNKDGTGGAPVIMADERPDLAKPRFNKDGTPKFVTEKDIANRGYDPRNLGKQKYAFDLKKGKTDGKDNGVTGDVVYDPYQHQSDSPVNDQFTSAWNRPDWRVLKVTVLKSDVDSGYLADKAAMSVGPHEWKGGAVDNQLPKDRKRKVYLSRMARLDRLVPESEIADIVDARWGDLKKTLEFPDTNLHPALREELIKRGYNVSKTGKVRYLRNAQGRVVGTFNRATNEITLYRGANAKTVTHELSGHAMRLAAEQAAANGDRRLLDRIERAEREAPKDIVDEIRRKYPDADEQTLNDEIWAALRERHNKAVDAALKTRQGREWYARAWTAMKDAWRSLLTRLGYNRADISRIDSMSNDEFLDFLDEAMAKGKTVAKLAKPTGDKPTMERGEKFKELYTRKMSDRYDPWRVLGDELRAKSGGKEIADPYYEMRVRAGHDEADKRRIDSIEREYMDFMRKHHAEITTEDMGAWLRAKDALFRNPDMEKRLGVKDGAGISTDRANEIKNKYIAEGKEAVLEEGEAILRQLQQEFGLDQFVESGMLDAKTAKDLHVRNPDYVPQMTDMNEDGEFDRNLPRNLEASAVKRAFGRKTEADNPVGFMFEMARSNAARINKNHVRQEIAKLVRQFPELGRTRAQNYTSDVDAKGEKVWVHDKFDSEAHNPNLIAFREHGQKTYIELDGKRGELLAQAARDEGIRRGYRPVQATTAALASTATRFSAAFGGRNALKDTADAAAALALDLGWNDAARFLKHQTAGLKKIVPLLAEYNRTGKIAFGKENAREGEVLKLMVEKGALIGGMTSEGYQRTMRKIENDQKTFREKYDKAGAAGKGKLVVDAAFKWPLEKIDAFNGVIESLTRYSDFYTRLEATGKIDRLDTLTNDEIKKAVIGAREDLTDFNKWGQWRVMNDIYMFANSTMGSTLRGMKLAKKTLTDAKIDKLAAFVGVGAVGAMLRAAMRGEDDEGDKNMTERDRAENLLTVRIGDRYFRVPMHRGPYSLLMYAGDCLARASMGELSWGDAAKNLTKEAATIASHLSGAGEIDLTQSPKGLLNQATPSLVRPLVELATNRNYADKPIYQTPISSSDTRPRSEMSFANTGEGWKMFARAMNAVGNAIGLGDEGTGTLDNPPEVYRYLAEVVTKNLGRDVANFASTGARAVESVAKRENKMVLEDVPFVGDFVRNVPDNTRRYQDAKASLAKPISNYKEADYKKRIEMAKEIPALATYGYLEKLSGRIDELRHRERGEVRRGRKWVKPDTPVSDKLIEEYTEQRIKLQKEYLDFVERKK